MAVTASAAADAGAWTNAVSAAAAATAAGRIAGGWLADEIGWRGMLLVFAAACALVAAGCLVLLPPTRSEAGLRYGATLRSLPGLFVRHTVLRVAAARGALWFFAFCAIWAGLAVVLSEPPYSYSAERIGLYALAGVSGVLATRVAGAWTDRIGARRVMLTGLALAGAAAFTIRFTLNEHRRHTRLPRALQRRSLRRQVATQSTVLAIDPAAPARFNSAYMLVYFVGGSLGTAFGAAAAEWLGWPATAAIAATAVGGAVVITVIAPTRAAEPELAYLPGHSG